MQTQFGLSGDALRVHGDERLRLAARVAKLARVGHGLSAARLITFFVAVTLLGTGFQLDRGALRVAGFAAFGLFLVLVVVHARLIGRKEREELRAAAHARHLARADGGWTAFPAPHENGPGHPYALDIDLAGPGSLMQRIDVTRTQRGRTTLQGWLSAASDADLIRARQQAVAELARMPVWRVELEVAAQRRPPEPALGAEGFVKFARQASPLRPWHRTVMWALPILTVSTLIGGLEGLLDPRLWLGPAAVQAAIMVSMWSAARRHFDLLDARRPQLEAFARVLGLIEEARFEAPLLVARQATLHSAGRRPSRHLRSLSHWAGLAETRMQVMVHPALNLLLMWDLHILRGLERWNERAGRHVDDWLWAIADVEALASLAALYGCDPGCTFPRITSPGEGLEVVGLAHPLLPAGQRVANDVSLGGPGAVLVVTGSNMAGKSTLLRSLGLNVALALAGGPVCAESMALPVVRLRASMRAVDALQQGASYFFAELVKLKTVVHALESDPPVLFLLDELLRGTNARARAIGATAVVRHLIAAGAMGAVATHDPSLCELAHGAGLQVENVHLTDVLVDGEMSFDYRLRPGPATTSNALRLLELAGIGPESAVPSAHT